MSQTLLSCTDVWKKSSTKKYYYQEYYSINNEDINILERFSAVVTSMGSIDDEPVVQIVILYGDETGNYNEYYTVTKSREINVDSSNPTWQTTAHNVNGYSGVSTDASVVNYICNIPVFSSPEDCRRYFSGELTLQDSLNYNELLNNMGTCVWDIYYNGEVPNTSFKLLWKNVYLEKYWGVDNIEIQLGCTIHFNGESQQDVKVYTINYNEAFFNFSYVSLLQDCDNELYNKYLDGTLETWLNRYPDFIITLTMRNKANNKLLTTGYIHIYDYNIVNNSRVDITISANAEEPHVINLHEGTGSDDNGYLDRNDDLEDYP